MGAAERGGRKIATAQLERMVAQGMSTRMIADSFGVQPPAVIKACHAANIALPGSLSIHRPAPKASVEAAAALVDAGAALATSTLQTASPGLDPRKEELVATGGRYLDLARWAGVWGVSLTHARFEWSRLRLPLAVERTR